MNSELFQSVRQTILTRQTFKVLSEPSSPFEMKDTHVEDQFVREAIQIAGWAPFHYDRKQDDVAEPWRCHLMWHSVCRQTAVQMPSWFTDMKSSNKLPAMLAACGALALVTWVPQTLEEIPDPKKLQTVNEEHLAATSAMIQNLLLLLTAEKYGSYWSSGGQFKTLEMFQRLGMPENEKLAGAIFIEYPQSVDRDLERLAGKNRSKRSSYEKWTREIQTLG